MQAAIKLNYGSNQHLLSQRMQQFPTLAKLINQTLGYTNIGNYSRAKVFTRQISTLDLASMNKILDLGCGYGENALMMAQALPHKKIFALDIDTTALARVKTAREKRAVNNLTIHQGKIDSMPESNFDLIYSVDVFEHIPAEVMPFEDCYAKLKTGGYLLVKIPNKRQHTIFNEKYFSEHNQWVAEEHPGQVYFLDDLVKRFEKAGFKVQLAEQTDGPLARLAWEIAYFMKKGGPITQLLSLPFSKLLVNLDLMLNAQGTDKGNAITVIGQKV
jgi:SAM-dependent methyltransferase